MTTAKKPKPKRVKWSVGTGTAAPRTAEHTTGEGTIIETLPMAEIEKLPKLSTTILKFAEPILSRIPDSTSHEELTHAMLVVTLAWNLPLYRQAIPDSEIRARWEGAAGNMPPPLRAVVEGMMQVRQTTYRCDPRIANVEVREGPDGKAVIHAEGSLVRGIGPDRA